MTSTVSRSPRPCSTITFRARSSCRRSASATCTTRQTTEYGVKGMGEGGAVATPPAANANAVRDALSKLGAELNETPLTSERVLTAINRAKRAA